MNQGFGARLAAILVFGILATLPARAADPLYLRIASGDVASGLFALAGSVAGAVSNPPTHHACVPGQSCGDLGLIAVAQTSASANAALLKLRSGGTDAVLIPATLAYTAYNGTDERLVTRWTGLRLLANLSVRPLLVIARADRPTPTLASLAGWRIAIGPRGSDASTNISILLTALGLTRYQPVEADIDASAADLISSGRADAVVLLADTLAAPELAAIEAGSLRLVDASKGELERALLHRNYLSRQVVDPGTGENYTTIASGNALLVRASMPEPVVLTILSRLWLKQDDVFNAGDAGVHASVPMHPSAENFYKEHSRHDQ